MSRSTHPIHCTSYTHLLAAMLPCTYTQNIAAKPQRKSKNATPTRTSLAKQRAGARPDAAEKQRRAPLTCASRGRIGRNGKARIGFRRCARWAALLPPNVLHDDLDGSSDTFFFTRTGFADCASTGECLYLVFWCSSLERIRVGGDVVFGWSCFVDIFASSGRRTSFSCLCVFIRVPWALL